MSHFAAAERQELADLLVRLGPDAPTRCAGWTTRDLAAHLVLREHRPDAALGVVVKSLAGRTQRVQEQVAQRDWPAIVTTLRRRPFWLAPVDELVNLMEFYTHHEDVRRAQPQWQPRQLPGEMTTALWRRGRRLARLVLRRTPAAVRLCPQGLTPVTAGRGGPEVILRGQAQELLLFLEGRQNVAEVELTGPEEVISRMRRAAYGI